MNAVAKKSGGATPPTPIARNYSRRAFVRVLAGCSALFALPLLAGCANDDKLVLAGATTILRPVLRISEAFRSENPELVPFASGGGSSFGSNAAEKGTISIAMIAREPTQHERGIFEVTPLCVDAIAIIISSSLKLQPTISRRDLIKVYRSTATQLFIHRIKKSAGHGTAQAFAAGLGMPLGKIQAESIAGSNGEVINKTSAITNAMGYVSSVDAYAAVKAGSSIKILAVDGILPTATNVENGTYPIRRTSYLLVRKDRSHMSTAESRAVSAFIEFTNSDIASDLIRQTGFVPANKGI